jgi:excisionase family DNA binding protein
MTDGSTPLYVRLAADETRRLEHAVAASGKSKRRLVGEAVRAHLTDEGLVVGHAALRREPDEVLTAAETAGLLRLDEPAVVAAAEAGELPGRRVGGHWRFSRAALLAWLAGDAAPPHQRTSSP